ncbi:hypothetical protein [Actinokineospora fastidiosa]|uniref:GAF domain-containing protein n=1 Tax=Actinokineospora fastidiosa TaxID=1816 RepID=A0A918GEG9_9PSEU|nr:hypothetical protein [Actinokineospora fastidiosa]GGS28572.1 hypothetical protein GCM10010171_22090 [Actinokineospora fastidiosa]
MSYNDSTGSWSLGLAEVWVRATIELVDAMLGAEPPPEPLSPIGRAARTATDAALVAVGRPSADGGVRLSVLAGQDHRAIRRVAGRDSLVSRVFTASANRISPDPVAAGVLDGTSACPRGLGSTALLTVADDRVVPAVLVLVRYAADPPFGEEHLALLRRLVDHGAALAALRQQVEAERVRAVADDRERIANGLRAAVLPELIAVGLALQNTVTIARNSMVRRRMLQVAARIDGAAGSLRSLVFGLEGMSR